MVHITGQILLPIVSIFWIGQAESFNILGICPSTSYSHQQPFQTLMKGLAARGHNITVISTIPLKKSVKNYEDIDLSFTYRTKDSTGLRHMSAFTLLYKNMQEANNLCEEQLFSPAIDQLIMKNRTFDAIIIEQLWYQCYYSLVKHYNFPVLIGFLSVGNLPYAMDSVGNPDDPVLNPDMAYPFTNRMATNEIIWNVLYTTWTRLYYRYWHLPQAQRIANKWKPDTSVYDIDKNFSLVILGNNHVFGYPKPLLPNTIEVHSLQISDHHEPLPNEIEEFFEGAERGVIYFSLGSNLQSHQLPSGALRVLCNALGSLQQRVLWKDAAAGDIVIQPANVKFIKWAPQQAILAHPKVIAYVMQGGLQSLQEAVYYSVPVVAIPFFGDQRFNARKILDAAIGLTLDIDTITEDIVAKTLTEVVNNKTYYENMKKLSAIVKDEQIKPIDKAIWNIEHVLKFPNSRHLIYHGKDISWLEYYLPLFLIYVGIIIIAFLCFKLCAIVKEFAENFVFTSDQNKFKLH